MLAVFVLAPVIGAGVIVAMVTGAAAGCAPGQAPAPRQPDGAAPVAGSLQGEAPAQRSSGSSSASTADPYGLGQVTPRLRALVEVLAPQFAITTVGGYRASARDPEGHPAGLAADFMVPVTAAGRAQGEALAAYAIQNAAGLGIDYIIWHQRIWSVERAPEGWRPMADRGSDTENHVDHVHINVIPDGTPVTGPEVEAAAVCAGQTVAGGGGGDAVVYPVPADLADTDRRNWGSAGRSWSSWHTGTDFSVPCGTPVLAAHAGTVEIDTTQRWSGPWLVKVSTGPTNLTTWYAHMQKLTVVDGQPVRAGQQIGEVGAEGNVSGPTGCHLHFEVHEKNGPIYGPDNVNPSTWLAENVGKSLGGGPGSFVIATFNALGHSHTVPGGDRPGWADSATRTKWLAQLLATQAPDVVGLQEFQAPQATVLRQLAGDTWDSAGVEDNVVIWRRTAFELHSKGTVAIPYFGGQIRQMPIVRLKHRSSGRLISVINLHNPADARGPTAKWRAQAIARERDAVARERGAGFATFLVGDLNDREQAFCPATAGGLLTSSAGGSNGAGGCQPPPDMQIDWIFGTGTSFSNHQVDNTPRGRISDHPYIEATTTPN